MEDAQKSMSSRARFLTSLGHSIGGSDSDLVLDTLLEYERLPLSWRSISRLRKELKRKSPRLFARDTFFEQGNELRLKDLSNSKESDLSPVDVFRTVEESLARQQEYIDEFKDGITTLFPSGGCRHSFRIKDYKSFSHNIILRRQRMTAKEVC